MKFLSPILLPFLVQGHGSMTKPPPRQPESPYWYQVGCLIGCSCSGGGKETYPTPESLDCPKPMQPTNNEVLTWNVNGDSPRGEWNKYMPWRAPGSAVPLDSCGIASGFLPTASVQYPHTFLDSSEVKQGDKGTNLPNGPVTTWRANATVEAAFSLIVNHGGGYQYRVCPKIQDANGATSLTEECFEKHPLPFATDTHMVYTGTKQIVIPATDLTIGVRPQGSTWRRIPIPACNCDLGSGCKTDSTVDDYASYSNSKAHGTCTTGLQFQAAHLDDAWPNGYGYYVASLDQSQNNKKSYCSTYVNSTACNQASACLWYAEKNICYETRKDKNKVDDAMKPEDRCRFHNDESSCTMANNDSGKKCTWYESDRKQTCYDKEKSERRRKLKNDKEQGNGDVSWYISDKLQAPSEPGDYVLQWRWDNEQTPQIWTTCADIQVVENDTTSSGTMRVGPPFALLLVLTSAAAWLLTTPVTGN